MSSDKTERRGGKIERTVPSTTARWKESRAASTPS